MLTLFTRKRASSLALAIALATGGATVATAVFPAEANAQRNRDRDRDRNQQQSDGGGYSDEFRAAYVPLNEALNAEGANVAALKPQVMALIPLISTNDEKISGGSLIYNAGLSGSDRELRLAGVKLMLESGKVPAEQVGRFNFIAYRAANDSQDYVAARRYLQASIDNNFTDPGIEPGGLQMSMAQTFFDTGEDAQGLVWVGQAVDVREASGRPAPEDWYDFAFARSYNAGLEDQAADWALKRVTAYPSAPAWLNAINVVRQFKRFGDGPELDMLRLLRKVGSMSSSPEYMAFVDAARGTLTPYPKEVKAVIEDGFASGNLDRTDPFYSEVYETVTRRVDNDAADLPDYYADARSAGATTATVVGAANASYSYDDFETAVEFYDKALGMPGVDRNEILNRKGMAQIGAGQFAAARETLAQVSGERQPIARLWIAYANELEMTTAATAAAPAVPETM